ncbi:hypothetical protein HPP92_015446 [Vanilla planifolia]|uniref:Uncharacterized protein n=1 Tax=Vanilla planifolia TaxID=51239 RepID=A0A835US19_VANPL|nr:hypothetical protein HPP92_015446 [Vanilla planifolia]
MLPNFVLSPLMAKNSGSRIPITKSSSFSATAAPIAPEGTANPNTNAPKTACTPMASVARAESITPTSSAQSWKSVTPSPASAARLPAHRITGRTRKKQNKTKPAAESRTQREVRAVARESAMAMARARSIHARTSFTTAADMAVRPISVLRSLVSARMRARTGNAVTESVTPRKRRKGTWWTLCEISWRNTKEEIVPMRKGSDMPATAITSGRRPMWSITLASISTPTRKRKRMRPMCATVSRVKILRSGNTVSANCWVFPNNDGPNTIPACNENNGEIQITVP